MTTDKQHTTTNDTRALWGEEDEDVEDGHGHGGGWTGATYQYHASESETGGGGGLPSQSMGSSNQPPRPSPARIARCSAFSIKGEFYPPARKLRVGSPSSIEGQCEPPAENCTWLSLVDRGAMLTPRRTLHCELPSENACSQCNKHGLILACKSWQ